MNKSRRCPVVVAGFIMLCMLVGCAKQSVPTKSTNHQQVSRRMIPEWAPKDPSPEFARAAKTLKSFDAGGTSSNRADEPGKARFHKILVPAWEFFGTLSDGQINRVVTDKAIRIPHKSLTSKQQDALSSFFQIYRETMKDVPPDGEWAPDALTELHKLGAEKDLSNVIIVVDLAGGHIVRLACVIQARDGQAVGPIPLTGLGTI